MANSYLDKLEDLKSDHSSGAWVITQKAVSCLEDLTNEKSGDAAGELIPELEKVASEILKAQPNMAQLTNLFNAIFMTIEQEVSDDPVVLARRIAGEAKHFDVGAKRTATQVAERGAELISDDGIVLTHSNSSTIFEIIRKAHEQGKSFQVIVSESRPVCEGRERANELSKLGIQTLYLIDAAIGMGIQRADVVLLGADSLSENSLVNKIGSTAICLLAREAVVPCYAACVSSKFTPQKLAPKKEPLREPKQVWDNPPPETVVENYYFDEVALDLFTGVITEDGIFTPVEMRGKVQAQKLSTKLLEMLK